MSGGRLINLVSGFEVVNASGPVAKEYELGEERGGCFFVSYVPY